jgi:hypothetical protein
MQVGSEIPLSNRERWLYGGLGALAPMVVTALTFDMTIVFQNPKLDAIGGYILRCALLFLVGGFVAFMHRSESDIWRCFVTGISAPALITTAMAGRWSAPQK